MESNLQSPPDDSSDARATFRKPTNDAANRKYRRHSPAKGSSSSEGSPPQHEPESSPVHPRDGEKGYEHHAGRRDNEKEMEIDSSRRKHSRNGDSYKYPDRPSSRRDHGYSKHDEYVRYDKHVDEDRLSSRSNRGSRSGPHSDHIRQESDRERPRDYSWKVEKYSDDRYDGSRQRGRDKVSSLDHHKQKHHDLSDDMRGSGRRHGSAKYENMDRDRRHRDRDGRDGKVDHRRDSGDNRSERKTFHEESREHLNDSYSGRDASKHSSEEAGKDRQRGTYSDMPAKGERKKYDDGNTVKEKEQYGKTRAGKLEDKSMLGDNQESASKKLKLGNLGKDTDNKDLDETNAYGEQAADSGNRSSQAQVHGNNTEVSNDPIAAKVAALKAAELVNRSLAGGGYMTADQKKKLLWGSKKSTNGEETAHRWDTALFGDRERQEKFNKLMSLSLPWYLWPIVGCEGRSEGANTRWSRWQWCSGSREAKSTPAGSREAVHCWIATKRWPYCWVRSLSARFEGSCILTDAITMIFLSNARPDTVPCGLTVCALFSDIAIMHKRLLVDAFVMLLACNSACLFVAGPLTCRSESSHTMVLFLGSTKLALVRSPCQNGLLKEEKRGLGCFL